MRKLLLFFFALLTGVGGAWATDHVVTVTTTSVAPVTNGSFTTDAAVSGYYTTWTSNAESGVAGLVLTTGGNLGMKSHDVGVTTYGTVLALQTNTTGGETAEDFTITAPAGYYIKSYSLEAKRHSSSSDDYTIQTVGGKSLTSIGTSTSTTWTEYAPFSSSVTLKVTDTKNMSTNYLCIVTLTVTLSDALPGTQLNSTASGVTWNSGASNWNNNWTSGTTPNVCLQCGNSVGASDRANFKAGSTSGSFILHSTGNPYYTISVPFGYLIKSYTIAGISNGDITLTPSEGMVVGSRQIFSASYANAVSVNGFAKNSVSFRLTGGSYQINNAIVYVEYVSASSITDLASLSNAKAYAVTNARGSWKFADDATAMSAYGSSINLYDDAYQVAIIQKNSEYYLFSVNAGKYLTASNTLTSMPTDAEQISITATGNATYPWFFKFKNVAAKNINVTSDTPPVLTIDSWDDVDAGNSNAIIEAADFDATSALAMFDTRTVTYNLSYGGNATFRTVNDITVSVSGDAAEFVPSSFVTPSVSLSYSPATIAAETTEVTVTATWEGPFQIAADHTSSSTKWYTLDMHSNVDKYTWYYDSSDDAVKLSVIAANAYQSLATTNLFCFVGNPWDGFKIYNKAAGDKTLHKASDGAQAFMTSDSDGNLFKLFASNGSIADSYCFKRPGDSNYLNEQSGLLQAYSVNDEGSSIRFFSPGSYFVNYIDGLYLSAPVGAVGTPTYLVAHPDYKSTLSGLKTTIESNLYSSDVLGGQSYLDPVRNGGIITLADGYWRIVSAKFSGAERSLVFNQSLEAPSSHDISSAIASNIVWSLTDKTCAGNIFYLSGSGTSFSIKNCNKDEYLSAQLPMHQPILHLTYSLVACSTILL